MADSQAKLIDVARLRIGLFVYLDLSWTEHPFPFNSFKIRSQDQIDTIRNLGLQRLRYSAERSDVEPLPELRPEAEPAVAALDVAPIKRSEDAAKTARREQLLAQQASLERCERAFSQASKALRSVVQSARPNPEVAREELEALIGSMVAEMTGEREVAIRLLSEKAGEETALHPLNVTVLSVLLGRACGLDEESLLTIGQGALMHDIGKLELPDRLHFSDDPSTSAERKVFQQHVDHGIGIAQRMGLRPSVIRVINEHHENCDGSGYPLGLRGEQMSAPAKVVGLVNHYDNLVNPGNPALAATPHDALAIMFAKHRHQFDATTMAVFIRMMGVYPPGSVVQLTDNRYALSVAVNPLRPLKPRVVVYSDDVPAEDSIILDLEDYRDLGVQRSIKPLQLPRAVFDYLSPRKRMCYFFERARLLGEGMIAS